MKIWLNSTLLLLSACGDVENAQKERPKEARTSPMYDEDDRRYLDNGLFHNRPLVRSLHGAEVEFRVAPSKWRLASAPAIIGVNYRNAPKGSGLLVSIHRDLAREKMVETPESGGLLDPAPIPIEGDSVFELTLKGEAYSAPADTPVALPLKTGRHFLLARIVNHRHSTLGAMIKDPQLQTIAEAMSIPVTITD